MPIRPVQHGRNAEPVSRVFSGRDQIVIDLCHWFTLIFLLIFGAFPDMRVNIAQKTLQLRSLSI